MTLDPRVFTELGIVTRIDDGEIEEVSNVDDPATAIDFAMFKAIEKAPGLADIEACLRENIHSPGECASQSEGFGNLLRADVRSHDDSGSPPERTEAIKGEPMRKIEAIAGQAEAPMPEDVPVEPAGETIEIPATPVDWSLPQCIQSGLDLGLNEDQAGQVCLVVRDQYGAPGEDGTILLPEGVKPEAILAATAEALGFAQLAGKRASVTVPKSYRGVGSYWAERVNRFLGRKSGPRPGEELARVIVTLQKKVEGLMGEQVKTREDLHRAMQLQDRAHARTTALLAAALNVTLPEEEDLEAEAVAAAPAPEAEVAPNPLAGEGKRKAAKCDPPAAAAPAQPAKAETPVAPTDSERIGRLEGLVEQLIQTITAGGAGVALDEDPGDELELEEDAALEAESLEIAGGVPSKRAGSSPLASARERIAQSKMATIAAISGRGGLPKGYERSSITGMVTSDADREHARTQRGVNGLHIKR